MAQGAIKKASKGGPSKPTQRVQRGNRVIKPKKQKLIAQNKLKKKSTSGLTAQTEKLLAEKAGHLEMLKGGKKDKKDKKEGGKAGKKP